MYVIKRDVLESIMGFSKSYYPNEFSALLVGDSNVINDIYIIPGTKNYSSSSFLRLDLAPLTTKLIGSVHSHPRGFGRPSLADLNFFLSKRVNIITYYPYSINDFKAYNSNGELISLKII